MLRSLHMKLVMIMVLLILSLMLVVGAFLVNSVTAFYLEDFYTQVSEVFSDPQLVHDLETEQEGEEDGAAQLREVLSSVAGELGVDGRNRKLYILNGNGECLISPDGDDAPLEYTENLLFALTQGLETRQAGDESNAALDYMDVAVPIQRGGQDYVIYILDNKTTANNLADQMIILIMEALVFGLVISILLSFLLSKTLVTPIQRLTEGAMRVAEGDFSRKIEVVSQDEIGVLTDTFNDMAGQLQDTLRQVENERNKLDTLFLHMTDGVVAFSREGTVIQKNPAAEDMLGRPILPEDTYEGLFGDLAPLEQILSLEQPGYQEAERTAGNRSLELPLTQESLCGPEGLQAAGKYDLSALMTLLEQMGLLEYVGEDERKVVSAVLSGDYELRWDTGTGTMAFTASCLPDLLSMMGTPYPKELWFTLNGETTAELTGLLSDLMDREKPVTVGALTWALTRSTSYGSPVFYWRDAVDFAGTLALFLGDDALVREGDAWVLWLGMDDLAALLGYGEEDAGTYLGLEAFALECAFGDDGAVTGSLLCLTPDESWSPAMRVTASWDFDLTGGGLEAEIHLKNQMKLTITGSTALKETGEKPETQVPDGAASMALEDLTGW